MTILKKLTQNPLVLLVSIAIGILFGIFLPNVVALLTPLNDIYTSLLQVTSGPVIIAALTVNMKNITQKEFHGVLKKWVIFSFLAVFAVAALGVGISVGLTDFLKPSDPAMVALLKAKNELNNQNLSSSFSVLTIYEGNNITNENSFSFIDFFIKMFPQNIFASLSENSTLQIFVFFIILGIMLNFVDDKYANPIINLLDGFINALSYFIDLLLLFLPISVFIAMAVLFSNKNTINILDSIVDFIVVNYIAMIIVIILSFIIIFLYNKTALKNHLSAIKRTFFVSIGTNTRAAAIPFTIEDSVKNMNADKTILNSLLPISASLFPIGTVLSAAILAVYAVIIYNQQISISILITIIIGAILFSLSKSGGASTAALLMLILQPLGVPTEIMSIILTAASSFYSGISTFVDIYFNLAIALSVSNKKNKEKQQARIQMTDN